MSKKSVCIRVDPCPIKLAVCFLAVRQIDNLPYEGAVYA